MSGPMFDFRGASALVTGAARGIGLAIASALSRQGCSVTLADIDGEEAERAAHQTGSHAAQLDVADTTNLTATVERALCGGDLAVMVNNAAVLNTEALGEVPVDAWERALKVNLTAAFHATQAVARVVDGRPGRIINVASLAGKQGGGLFGTSAYATSKGGLLAFTKSTARELAPRGITANAIAPGPVDTTFIADQDPRRREYLRGLIPLGRFAVPEDVAAAACFLGSREPAYITGAVLDVNGGMLMD